MSSDESLKDYNIIPSTPHPKKGIERPSSNFVSPSKLTVNYKIKRKKKHSSGSKAKRKKIDSSSSTDNIYSSTFLRQTTSSSKSSKSSLKSTKSKRINFSPIEKWYSIPSRSEVDFLQDESVNEENVKNTVSNTIIDDIKDNYEQDNELKDDEDIIDEVDNTEDIAPESPAIDDDDNLAKTFRSLSTTPEEERTDIEDFVTKTPVHSVKKQGLKQKRTEFNNVKKSKDKSTHSMYKKHIFPRYYPLGWMAIYNVGRRILNKILTCKQAIISPMESKFPGYREWKRMLEEGSILKTPPRQVKAEEYLLPIEITATPKEISEESDKKRSSKIKKNKYSKKMIKKGKKSKILSDEDIKKNGEQIREHFSIENEILRPQNLSDDFAHLINNPNITLRPHTISTSISAKKETSGTSNELKNRIQIISNVEFEDPAKICLPFKMWKQYKNIVNKEHIYIL